MRYISFEREYVDAKGRTIVIEIEHDGLRYISRRFVNCNETNISYSSTSAQADATIKNFLIMSPPVA
jgi:hypothetical protein